MRDVERELHRLAAAAQLLVEAALDAGEALVVDVGEADDMGGEAALGIDAALLVLEMRVRECRARLTGDSWRGVRCALDPDEALVGR